MILFTTETKGESSFKKSKSLSSLGLELSKNFVDLNNNRSQLTVGNSETGLLFFKL